MTKTYHGSRKFKNDVTFDGYQTLNNEGYSDDHLVTKSYVDANDQDVVLEALTLTMDSVGGADPTSRARMSTQAEIDAWGSFKTIAGALSVIPSTLIIPYHATLQFPAGEWTWNASEFYELARFNTSFGIVFRGHNSWVQVPTTPASMAVSSEAGGVVTLTAPHGLPADTYKAHYLYVLSGTGVGEYRAITGYSVGGSNFTLVSGYETTLDVTSVVQIADPATVFTISGASSLYGELNSRNLLLLYHVKMQGSGTSLNLNSINLSTDGGCRFVDVVIVAWDSLIGLDDNLIDARASALSAIQITGGTFRQQSTDNPTLVFGSGAAVTALRILGAGQKAYTGQGTSAIVYGSSMYFQGWGPSYIDLNGTDTVANLKYFGGVYLGSDQLATTAVILRNGAQLLVTDAADIAASTFGGVSSDVTIDDETVTWEEIDADPVKSLDGPKGSVVSEGG